MTDTFTITLREVDGEPMMDALAMALAFGVDVAAVKALPIVDGRMRLPREWARRGKQRAKEAMAHGSDGMLDCLRYWARRDHDAELQVVYR
ncbi:hypothetical protein C0J29_11740 [Mycobacterium paragordonae]|uniref:Uncharacterized protein n=1 Tax=Mycobacterium paragordonae TaxID=1389713 RepID=A0ABQ1C2D3_9MYCO|nr:hypothetical protein [Mycobacterium paragordonae]AYE95362.1 hypothetical protein C0J29_11740 [Mycobacterium paragordonae]GFG78563.1 hypothetical protein MPRG_18390 [Mycobacterium paragordonae]